MNNSPFERFDSVTPTTPRLSNTLKNRINTDHSLWATYSPKTVLSYPKTPILKSKTTPVRNPEIPIYSSNMSISSNLTDNLLHLNVAKRPKAADFFS